jgi:NAD(P)-dependent dehydrogenase (short-subunit alcohol dehydrogenase family)
MINYFQGKVIVITGGGSGLGLALAIEMAHLQAKVHVLDIKDETFSVAGEWGPPAGINISFHQTDVTNYDQFSQVIGNIYEMEERIDVLINNAGINITGEARDMSIEHWKKTLNVNLMGTVNGIAMVYSRMARQSSGQIVNISSMAGLAPIPLISPYVTSKYAIVGLSRSLRQEAKDLGIKINLVCPGRLNTNIMESSDILQVNRDKFMDQVPFDAISLPVAVKKIIRGMIANKPLIIFPAYVRWLWWADRYLPFILKPFYRYSINKFRKLRDEYLF